MYLFAADALLILHFSFVCFVVGGLALIWIGYLFKWRFIYNRIFRVIHLLAIGIVILQAFLGQNCPLTIWENKLRVLAGEGIVYQGSFIQYWVHTIMFFNMPQNMFTIVYAAFFIVVCLTFIVIRPRRRCDG